MTLSQHGDTMKDNDKQGFKPIDNAFTKEIRSDLETHLEKFRDPVVMAEMAYRLLEERENTNRLLKTMIQRLETIEAKLSNRGTASQNAGEELMLPEIDEQILNFVKAGKVTAEEVREKFNYRGKNAASARLNRLYELGLLQKRQVGKKVFFFSE